MKLIALLLAAALLGCAGSPQPVSQSTRATPERRWTEDGWDNPTAEAEAPTIAVPESWRQTLHHDGRTIVPLIPVGAAGDDALIQLNGRTLVAQ